LGRLFLKQESHPLGLGRSGFTLIEILLSLAIVSVILIFLLNSFQFVQHKDKVDQAHLRMDEIATKLRAYYRSQQSLPDPFASPPDSVPVQLERLDLPQKYRLDGHGQFFRYFVAPKIDEYSDDEITDIVGFDVDGRRAGGVLISLGPNQTQQYTVDNSATPPVYQSAGDDILAPITVNEEAMEIVMEELDVLQKRVAAYDRIFAGVGNDNDLPNDGDSQYDIANAPVPPPPYDPYDPPANQDPYKLVDEDGCSAIIGGTGGAGCLPTEGLFTNDPNCGTATIDACPSALNDLITLYGLGQDNSGVAEPYRTDPWGNLYQWGNGNTLNASDRRYHVFFSMGPDSDDPDDDVTPY